MKTYIFTVGVVAALAAQPAFAQTDDGALAERASAPYAVARVGVAADTDFRFPRQDRSSPSTFEKTADFKPGFTGELGGGYDFGGFRLEATVGYSSVKLDRGKPAAGIVFDGRARSLNLGVSGYVDIPVGGSIVPYVGGGIGASRVDARLTDLGGVPATGSRFSGRDWGLSLHADAGIAARLSPSTALELGARYTRVSKLEYDGAIGLATGSPAAAAETFKPRLSSVSAMVGIRQGF